MLWGAVTLALTAQGLTAMVTRALPITSPLPLDGPLIPQVCVVVASTALPFTSLPLGAHPLCCLWCLWLEHSHTRM